MIIIQKTSVLKRTFVCPPPIKSAKSSSVLLNVMRCILKYTAGVSSSVSFYTLKRKMLESKGPLQCMCMHSAQAQLCWQAQTNTRQLCPHSWPKRCAPDPAQKMCGHISLGSVFNSLQSKGNLCSELNSEPFCYTQRKIILNALIRIPVHFPSFRFYYAKKTKYLSSSEDEHDTLFKEHRWRTQRLLVAYYAQGKPASCIQTRNMTNCPKLLSLAEVYNFQSSHLQVSTSYMQFLRNFKLDFWLPI